MRQKFLVYFSHVSIGNEISPTKRLQVFRHLDKNENKGKALDHQIYSSQPSDRHGVPFRGPFPGISCSLMSA